VRIFGFALQEAVGQSLDIVIPAAQSARHWHGCAGGPLYCVPAALLHATNPDHPPGRPAGRRIHARKNGKSRRIGADART
jgi:hypothetical protein